MRFKLLIIIGLSFAALGMEWMAGCTKRILPVVPSNLPGSTTQTPTTTCVMYGTHDPAPVATIQVSNDHYVSRLYSAGAICGTGLNEFQVYVNNLDSGAATLEVAVYDGSQQVADGSLDVPAGDMGWRKVSVTPFSISCSDPVVLAVHASGSFLTIGAASGGADCDTDGGGQTGPMPATYPNASFLTSSGSSGWCYEMSLDACGP